jgi:hypothetical protein
MTTLQQLEVIAVTLAVILAFFDWRGRRAR